jgi:N-acetylneuraminic acid mutarotase
MNGRRYDPATDTWTDIPDVPLPQLYKAAVEWSPVTEELIVFGGMRLKDGVTTPVDDDSYQASNETWAWALATNTWRRVASSPLSPRMASQAVWDGDAIVFTWGQPYEPFAEESHSTAGAAAYDPVTDTWTTLAEPPVQDRMTFGDHRIGGSHAVFWGGHPALGDGDFWLTLHDGAAWDAATGDWQVISDFGLPGTYRSELSTWSANGRLYVWGGSNYEDDGTLNNDWPVDGAAWSPATGTWQQLPPAPAPRASAVAVWTGCDAIVYGGNTPMQTTNNSGAILRP